MSKDLTESNNYKGQIDKFGVVCFVPQGDSMYPFIKNRKQSVCVSKITVPVKEYDALFYKRNNGDYVLLRVIKVEDNGYLVCGDSQMAPEWVEKENAVGVMTEFIKGKKTVVIDENYRNKVKKWYKCKVKRGFSILYIKIKRKLKGIFRK